jgi:ParB/RepB/Spo0J family partition protein
MAKLILVELLQPNKWNPNVMGDVEYQALRQDMQIGGPQSIDPVLASPWSCFYLGAKVNESYVIVDGEHRWRAAQELGWKEILCEVREITEDDAKAICYRRNRERGNIDPFKEAALFNSELDRKRSQKQIADKYLVDPSTVSHRLSLLRIQPKIIETVRKLPRGMITPSHLEPIATLEPEDQKGVELRSPYSDGVKSVRQIEAEVTRVKEMRVAEKALAEAVAKAKFPKCPRCKKEPVRIHYKKLPWVSCDRGHEWNLNTGKGLYDEERIQQNRLAGKPEIRVSSVLRSAHTVKELADVFGERIRELVPKLTQITDVRISGMLEGSHFSFDLNVYAHTMSVYVNHGDSSYMSGQSFRAEEHEYRSGEKSAVHCDNPESIKKVEKFIDDAFQGKLVEPRKKKGKSAEASAL